ncbi:MAG: short-chain dehydrogenase, partial [Burkholderia contaminans]
AGVRTNKRRVLIGRDAKGADWMARILPAAYQALVVLATRREAAKARRAARGTPAAAPLHATYNNAGNQGGEQS